jgi:hypothetical protein
MKIKSSLLLIIVSIIFTFFVKSESTSIHAKSSNTIPQFIQDQIALEALNGIHHEIKKTKKYQTEHFINYKAFNREPLIKLIKTDGGCNAEILKLYYDAISERIENILNTSCDAITGNRLEESPEAEIAFHHCTAGDVKCICGHHPERAGCSTTMAGTMAGMSGSGSSSSGGMSQPIINNQCIPSEIALVVKKNTDKYLDRLYNALNADQNSNLTPDVCENNSI